jgi:hypothetical protein
MPATPRHITLSPGAENALGDRSGGKRGLGGDRSAAVSRMMERYAEVCRRHLPDLTEAEWNLLRDSMNGLCPEPAASVAWLAMGVRDSIALDHLDEKWDVDGLGLIRKLDALDYAGCCAVLDAVERWWVEQG